MKTLIALLVFLFISTASYGQLCGPASESRYEQVNKTTVKYIATNKCDREVGYLKIMDNQKLIRHGIWKSYCKGKLKMSVKYEFGKVVWIKTDKQPKITHNEIVYLRTLKHDNTIVADMVDEEQ